MSEIKFDDNSKRWIPIEKAIPGAKDAIQELLVMIALSNPDGGAFVRQNKKTVKNLTINKYHICSRQSAKQDDKLATIYISSKDEYKIRFFLVEKKRLKTHEAMVVMFSNLDDLRKYLTDWVIDM